MTILCILALILILTQKATSLNILVVGGSGRVGGSTVRWLDTLSKRQSIPSTLTVGGRRRDSFEKAIRNRILPNSVDFLSLDVDGDASLLRRKLENWKSQECLVVHTAGPFQGRRDPILLETCIDLGIPYVDVCDEWDLAEVSKEKLHQKAVEKSVCAVVSCGIWPGVSALMAKRGVDLLTCDNKDMEVESIDYSFFTAGTGSEYNSTLCLLNLSAV